MLADAGATATNTTLPILAPQVLEESTRMPGRRILRSVVAFSSDQAIAP